MNRNEKCLRRQIKGIESAYMPCGEIWLGIEYRKGKGKGREGRGRESGGGERKEGGGARVEDVCWAGMRWDQS